jgi:hypothetical protein
MHSPAIGLDGKLYGGRREAFCNNMSCDQRYWYIPRSGRITRRNTGITYQEWRLRRVDLRAINVMRQHEGMTRLIEDPITIINVGSDVSPESVKEFRASFDAAVADPPAPDLRQFLFEKWCVVRAFFVVYVPGFRRFSVCDEEEEEDAQG